MPHKTAWRLLSESLLAVATVGLLASSALEPRRMSGMVKADDVERKASDQANPLDAAQLQKLNLEIESLRRKNGWPDKISVFIPVITACVTVAGFWAGLWQFKVQQEKDREVKLRDQQIASDNLIRANINELAHAPPTSSPRCPGWCSSSKTWTR